MRKHVDIGWLLLDEWVGRDPGRSSSWIDTGLRRRAGRVLPAQDDPEYVAPSTPTPLRGAGNVPGVSCSRAKGNRRVILSATVEG